MTPLFALALSAAMLTCGQDQPTAAGLRAAEADWVDALETRDVEKLRCRLADEFADNNWRGRHVTRDSVLAALPNRPMAKLSLSEIEAHVFGQTGLVQGRNDQTGPDGRPLGAVRFTDVFVYRARRWQAIAAQETLIQP